MHVPLVLKVSHSLKIQTIKATAGKIFDITRRTLRYLCITRSFSTGYGTPKQKYILHLVLSWFWIEKKYKDNFFAVSCVDLLTSCSSNKICLSARLRTLEASDLHSPTLTLIYDFWDISIDILSLDGTILLVNNICPCSDWMWNLLVCNETQI